MLNFLYRYRIIILCTLQGIIIILGVLAVTMLRSKQKPPNDTVLQRNAQRQKDSVQKAKDSELLTPATTESLIKPERFTVADHYSIDTPTGYLLIQVVKDTKTSDEYLVFQNTQTSNLVVIPRKH